MSWSSQSREVAVLGTTMAYVEAGDGETLLFIHGNPSSSFQWRNVVPALAQNRRCIAVDLIGMGRSAKPDIEYDFDDHARHLSAFVEALELAEVTLVLHDWGIALGLDLGRRHPALVRRIALVARGEDLSEGVLEPIRSWDDLSPEAREVFTAYWSEQGPELVLEQNHFVEVLMPGNTLRRLSDAEQNAYRSPFPDAKSRYPILAFNRQVPIAGQPPGMAERIEKVSSWLCSVPVAKLLLHATADEGRPLLLVDWAIANLCNLTVVDVGPGLHYLTEDRPKEIANALADWLLTDSSTRSAAGSTVGHLSSD